MDVVIRRMERKDVVDLVAGFGAEGWERSASGFEAYLDEQDRGERVVLIALAEGRPAGFGSLVWTPSYPGFREAGIPEVHDLNVLPSRWRQGVATHMMDELERLAGERSSGVGIGVGMHPGYGPAQRLYVLRGYVPDARGLSYDDRPVKSGETLPVDDGLNLHLVKDLRV
ncbi:MAG: GNAT family N-acetyltransferase [Planctomycetota bacterium]